MPVISRSALVHYSAAEMFQLVDAIEDYPKFLPWCKQSHILSRDDDEVRATLEIAYSGAHKQFTTCNRLQKNKMIEIRLLDGPFHHLEGFWRFAALDEQASKISLDMEFEISNKLLSFAFSPVFHKMSESMVEAFCQRAEKIYGKR